MQAGSAAASVAMFQPLGLDRSSNHMICIRGRAAEGHRVLYDREVPFEIRNQTDPHDSAQEVFRRASFSEYSGRPRRAELTRRCSRQVGTLEAIKVKILIMGEEQNPLTLRIELTSENDLFFHFNHNLDEHGFRQVCVRRLDQIAALA